MPNKIQKEKDSFLKRQEDIYNNASKEKVALEGYLENLELELLRTKKTDENYDELVRQTKELSKRISGLNAIQENASENLKLLGEEQLAQRLKEEALEQATSAELDNIRQRITDTGKRIVDLRKEGKEENKALIESLEEQIEADKATIAAKESNLEAKALKAQQDTSISAGIGGLAESQKLPQFLKDIAGAAASKEKRSNAAAVAGFEEVQGKLTGPLGTIASTAGKIFDVVLSIRNSVNQWVDTAADVLSNNVGRINAALEGTGKLISQ